MYGKNSSALLLLSRLTAPIYAPLHLIKSIYYSQHKLYKSCQQECTKHCIPNCSHQRIVLVGDKFHAFYKECV